MSQKSRCGATHWQCRWWITVNTRNGLPLANWSRTKSIARYCAPAVAAEAFVLPKRRPELPVVPACEQCNNSQLRLENYLTAIFPAGAIRYEAHETIESLAGPRWARYPRVRGGIIACLERAALAETARTRSRVSHDSD
jgi:hypothetical protein